VIERALERAARTEYDLVVVGGGVYGVALLLEAARRGVSACLCEAADFGGGTSANSLRIVHGGLRYLQTFNLRRFWQSVGARRATAADFPELVRPLSCLMPLYGRGLARPSVLRLALAANDGLSLQRNRGLRGDRRIPRGALLDREAALCEFPMARRDGLLGAARWSDYTMHSSERLIVEMLRWACSLGATALNHARVEELLASGGRAVGVAVRDERSGRSLRIGARAVVSCAGPELDALAGGRGSGARELFQPSLAFNVLLDAVLEARGAVAVSAPAAGSPVLFLLPQQGSVLAGTMHVPRPAGTRRAEPSEAELEQLLAGVRAAVPRLEVKRDTVRRVFAGLLPVRAAGTVALCTRERVIDHGRERGLRGFYSLCGVKFTTARSAALEVLAALARGGALPPPLLTDARRLWQDPPDATRKALLDTVRDESVSGLDDLIVRRSNWATTELDLERVRRRVEELAPGLCAGPGAGAQGEANGRNRPCS
jgi:glycerol-3-phosphate dehydrogenase